MKRLILIVLVTLLCMAGWVGVTLVAASEGWWRKPLVTSDAPDVFMSAARELVEDENNGNFAMVLLDEGEVAGSHYASIGQPVDGDTLFQVASLSKWLAAWGVMRLIEDGAVDLDAPVSTYLTRWSLPASSYGNEGVTIRRLLSHTAGLGDGLGYNGFEKRDDVQSLEASLSKAGDASPAANGTLAVVQEPGSEWDYSGGGYTLLQLLIEEVSGQSFGDYMKARVFEPLGMDRSTFDFDEAREAGLAENYRLDGETEPFRYYTALAATSAFTSANDLTAFAKAQIPALIDESETVLRQATLRQMRSPHASQLGADIWGLGVMLYAPNNTGDFIIGHDGNNEPAINSAVRVDPVTGSGIIILTTGNDLLATRLAGEWVYWTSGNVDFLTFASELETTIGNAIAGSVIIFIAGLLFAFRVWRLLRLLPTRT